MNAIQKLRSLHGEITTSGNGFKIVDAWATVGRLLPRMPVDPAEAARVVEAKDAAGLDALIGRLERPSAPAEEAGPEFPENELDHALRAFRKRLKVQRLADESKLGGRYTSGGRKSQIDAITPPEGFPAAIWKALARKGRLVDTGQGFYAEPKPGP
ncbi:MAG: hypothetical protein ACF8SC_01295 [Phycisphaerales bacterium JB037]